MKKGTIVSVDGINSHIAKIDHKVVIKGQEYFVMSSVSIDGQYEENHLSDEEAFEAGFVYPIDVCHEADKDKLL